LLLLLLLLFSLSLSLADKQYYLINAAQQEVGMGVIFDEQYQPIRGKSEKMRPIGASNSEEYELPS